MASRTDGGGGTDGGSVTVEFALILPAVVAVLALAMSAGAWALEMGAAQRGASEAARAAITSSDSRAVEVGMRTSGGMRVTLTRESGFVTACAVVHKPPWPDSTRCASARDSP